MTSGLASLSGMKKRSHSTTGKKSITIRDVVNHMQGMEQRLSKGISNVDKRVDQLNGRIDQLDHKFTHRMDSMEENLTRRMDALDEDLTATIMDTIKIRKHVGMAVPDEE